MQARHQKLEEASRWLMRLEDANVTKAELDAWNAWLEASPDNAKAFDDISLLWESAAGLSSDDLDVAPDDRQQPPELVVRREPAQPGATQPMRGARWQARRRRHSRSIRWVGMLASVLMLGVLWYTVFDDQGAMSPVWTQRYATTIGVQRTVHLQDGSLLRLGADSVLEVEFSPETRYLHLLQGQAYFDVANANQRPFEVRAGGARILDLGTRFDVGLRGDNVVVSVQEGRVQVQATQDVVSGHKRLELVAGQRTRLHGRNGWSVPRSRSVAGDPAWFEDVMEYRGTELAVVVADMNRYSPIPIELQGNALAAVPVTGRWNARDVSDWVSGLARALSLSVTCSGGHVVLAEGGNGAGARACFMGRD